MVSGGTLLQWNCRGLKPNFEELELLTKRYTPTLVCLQETKLKPTSNISFKGYEVYSKSIDAVVAHGGVAVLVRKDIPQSITVLNTRLQAVAVRVSLHVCLTVCSLYLPPDLVIQAGELDDLLLQLPPPVLLLGDFNAHSPMWGCLHLDIKGHIIEDFVQRSNLCILNDKTPTYVHPATGSQTAIDLSIGSPSLILEFAWSAHDDLCGSDHHPIVLHNSKPIPENKLKTWKLYSANWTLFTELCEKHLNINNNPQNIDTITLFTSVLTTTAENTIPKTSGTFHRQSKPWFDDTCRAAIKERRKALCKLKKAPTAENLTNFRKTRAKTRQTLRASKKQSWQNYVSKLNSGTSSKQVWDIVRKINGTTSSFQSVKHLTVNNAKITDHQQICNTIAATITHNSSNNFYSPTFLNNKQKSEQKTLNFTSNNKEYYNLPITEQELTMAILHSQDSSPGPDTVHYQFLKHLPRVSLLLLLQLFNDVFSGDKLYPAEWRLATIIPSPKPNKDHTDPNNYRPIALTSCLCKILERIVNNRLVYYLESNDLLTPTQSGFRKGRSTVDHLVRLETWIREGIANREHVVAIFFDLEKAYDTTWKYGILQDLFNFGLRGNLPKFVQSFLQDRSFKVRIGTTFSDTHNQLNGVPQGSILSVTLFGVKINSITNCVLTGVDNSLFVDDFLTCCRSKSMRTVERKLQLTMNNLSAWCDQNGFKFSDTKTVCVHFCNQRKQHDHPEIRLGNRIIPVENEVKFLGVIFDSKLSFLPHLRGLRTKCQKSLNLLRVVAHKTWGGDTATLLKLYTTLVRSKLDYGCIVYGSARNSYLKMLDPIQNQAVRLSLGAFRTSPIESLQAESGIMPLSLRRQKLSLQYFVKLHANKNHPVAECVFRNWHKHLFDQRPNLIAPFGIRMERYISSVSIDCTVIAENKLIHIPPWHLTTPNVSFKLHTHNKSDLQPEHFKVLFHEYISNKQHSIHIYTDGSKDNHAVAAAAVCRRLERSTRLPDKASIFSAEAAAILLAFSIVRERRDKHFTIFSDSMSCLQAICGCKLSNPLICDILTEYQNLVSQGKVVDFCWTPSHVGIVGNERVDAVAKLALNSIVDRNIRLPYTDVCPAVAGHVHDRFKSDWAATLLNKLKEILPELKQLKYSFRNRHDESVYHRLRIGHTYITHGYLLRRETAPECSHCQSFLTVKHILLECPGYAHIRQNYFTETTLFDLFDKVHNSNILNFLKEIDMYNSI